MSTLDSRRVVTPSNLPQNIRCATNAARRLGDPETVLTVTAAHRFWLQSWRELGRGHGGALRLSLASVRSDLLKSRTGIGCEASSHDASGQGDGGGYP